jgi:hypothetical protein
MSAEGAIRPLGQKRMLSIFMVNSYFAPVADRNDKVYIGRPNARQSSDER